MSNVVLLAESGGVRVVCKQALPRLRVIDDWTADPARAQGEAAALRLLGALTPGQVPEVLDDDDPAARTVTLAAAPDTWETWKDRLLRGHVDPETAGWLGHVLCRWHTATETTALPPPLEHDEVFHQLRLDPFFGTSARRRPDLAEHLRGRAEAMATRRRCLVTGDYSPKNVLVGGATGWVIDLEVAHRGDPAFDLAFLLTHLVLKAVHRPDAALALRGCAGRFLDTYGTRLGADDPAHLCGLVGSLLLARVRGSSPASYLRPAEARQVEDAAAAVLRAAPHSIEEVWTMVVTR